jgi:hypothetical protein
MPEGGSAHLWTAAADRHDRALVNAPTSPEHESLDRERSDHFEERVETRAAG